MSGRAAAMVDAWDCCSRSPTALEVDVKVPPGTEILATSPAMQVSGDRAVWRGDSATLRRLEVVFVRPPVGATALLDRLLRRAGVGLE